MTKEEIEKKIKENESKVKEIGEKIKPVLSEIDRLEESIHPEITKIEELSMEVEELKNTLRKQRILEWAKSEFARHDPDEEYNMILLQKGSFGDERYFWSSEILEDYVGTLYGETRWDCEKYNKHAHPLPKIDYGPTTDEVIDDLSVILPKMTDTDEIESTNIYWNMFFAVLRDYRIVGFVIRDDGMLLNERNPFMNIGTLE